MVEVGVVPGHDEGAGASGAAAHGGAGVGVVGEADVGVGFDQGEDFVLDELGIAGGEGVVFQAALAALRVATARCRWRWRSWRGFCARRSGCRGR